MLGVVLCYLTEVEKARVRRVCFDAEGIEPHVCLFIFEPSMLVLGFLWLFVLFLCGELI